MGAELLGKAKAKVPEPLLKSKKNVRPPLSGKILKTPLVRVIHSPGNSLRGNFNNILRVFTKIVKLTF